MVFAPKSCYYHIYIAIGDIGVASEMEGIDISV